MNYRLSNEAKADLINIHHFGIHQFGEAQADKYYFAFFKHFEIICENPYLFPSVDYIRKGYRRSTCGVDSIYYRITKNTVEIMAIVGNQNFNDKL